MLFDRTIYDEPGTYKRQSVTVALVGENKVPIHFAANTLGVHFPNNAGRGLYIFPHPNLDVARNLAIAAFCRETALGHSNEHLFLWPVSQYIKWDAIARAMEVTTEKDPVTRVGPIDRAVYCFHRSALSEKGKPWFQGDTWRGREANVLRDSASSFDEYMAINRVAAESPSHEEDGKNIFVTALPSLGYTSLVWISHAMTLAGPVAASRVLTLAIGREVAEARNRLVDSVLRSKPRPEYLFFFGDDMLPQPSSLQMIFETMQRENADHCAGLYHMKYRPPEQPLLWQFHKPGWMIPGRDFANGDLVRCAGTGMDFVVFKTEVFEKVPRPWFRTGQEFVEGKGVMIFTEDAYFWEKYTQTTGNPVLVDTRARIGHYSDHDGTIY